MKLNCLIIIVAFFVAGSVQAQHFNLGIKGGLNAYNIPEYNSGNKDIKFGYHFGLLGHFHLATQLAFQPEIVYSLQGIQNDANDSKIDLSYINIPLIFQYMYDNGFRLEAGPQLGILVNANSESGSTNTDVMNNFKSTDVSLAFGMSYVKPSTGFGIDIRYNYGLTEINAGGPDKIYNRGLQVGLFYLFEHKS